MHAYIRGRLHVCPPCAAPSDTRDPPHIHPLPSMQMLPTHLPLQVTISESASEAHRIVTLDGWLRVKVPADIAVLLVDLRREIDRLLQRLVERAAPGGGRGGGGSVARARGEDAAVAEALCDSIEALLEDAIVEPLPPPPRPMKPKAGGGSRKTRKRRQGRQAKKKRVVG